MLYELRKVEQSEAIMDETDESTCIVIGETKKFVLDPFSYRKDGYLAFSEMSLEYVRNYFAGKHTEKDLADAFAIVSNRFWSVIDNEYDYEDGSPEYIAACTATDEWGTVMKEYEEKIFNILRSEGTTIPETKRIHILEPFMKRNGYVNGNGWWIKEKN